MLWWQCCPPTCRSCRGRGRCPRYLTDSWSARAERGRSCRQQRSGRRDQGSLLRPEAWPGRRGRVWAGDRGRRAWPGRRGGPAHSHSAAVSGSHSGWQSAGTRPGNKFVRRRININLSCGSWHFPRFELNWLNFQTRQPEWWGWQNSAAGSGNAS